MTEKKYTELKTLKDFLDAIKPSEYRHVLEGAQFSEDDTRNGTATREFIEKTLRQEAIKWVKRFNQCSDNPTAENPECPGFFENSDYHEHGAVVEWLTHFFNLSEDDLK